MCCCERRAVFGCVFVRVGVCAAVLGHSRGSGHHWRLGGGCPVRVWLPAVAPALVLQCECSGSRPGSFGLGPPGVASVWWPRCQAFGWWGGMGWPQRRQVQP